MQILKRIKTLKPLNNTVITTANVYEEDQFENGVLVVQKGSVCPYQIVVAIGPMVRDINVGDVVEINPANYTKKKYDNSIREDLGVDNPIMEIAIPTINISGVNHFNLFTQDIKWVVELEETPEDKTKIIDISKPKIII